MIALLLDHHTLHVVAPLVIAALMVWAFLALTAAVIRTSSAASRHAAFWSPPRPHRILAAGKHTPAGRRRIYHREQNRHGAGRVLWPVSWHKPNQGAGSSVPAITRARVA